MRVALATVLLGLAASVAGLPACSAIVQPDTARLGAPDGASGAPDAGNLHVDAAICEAGTTRCGDGCVDVATDPDHCGGCGRICGAGERCRAGMCTCEGDVRCSGAPGIGDPNDCGPAHTRCDADQVCLDGTCRCRPPLQPVPSVGCVDVRTDPERCGAAGVRCPAACFGGICVARCPETTEDCGGSCVDVRRDPRHCGRCDRACAADEVCAAGDCVGYRPTEGCRSCPCEACEGVGACCTYPGLGRAVCLEAERCP